MRKTRFARIACFLALLLLFSACGGKSRTVMVNESTSMYYDGITMEVTVRELVIDGNDATVRMRFLNRSEDTMGSVGVRVAFLDEAGEELYADEVTVVCEYPIPSGDGISATAECSGRNVKNIVSVRVSALES